MVATEEGDEVNTECIWTVGAVEVEPLCGQNEDFMEAFKGSADGAE